MLKNSKKSKVLSKTAERPECEELSACTKIAAVSRSDKGVYALITLRVSDSEQYCVYVNDGEESVECLGASSVAALRIFELLVRNEVSADQLFYVLCDIKSDFDGSFFN